MLIGDGVTPGNEGRGYVLRRLLRRAVRSMRLLGVDAPTLDQLLPVSMERMKASYPELETDFSRISQVAYAEEEAFRRTLQLGHDDPRHRGGAGQVVRRDDARRRRGVRAARHLRLPDRPDPRDGGGAGPAGRRARLPPAHGRAARPRQGRRPGEEVGARGHERLPAAVRHPRARRRVHRLRPDRDRHPHPRADPGRRRRRPRAARRRDRDRPRPHAALRGVRWPAGRPRAHPPRERCPHRGHRRPAPHHRPRRAPRDGARGRGGRRRGRRGRGRRRAPPVDLARPHGDPHGAPGPARRAR